MELNKIYNTDCLGPEGMVLIPDKSIDMILCDLPYGTTACKWDTIIPFEPLWEQYERVIKDSGVIVLFADEPFTSYLITSRINLFKYRKTWDKKQGGGFLNSHKRPLTQTEDICIFSKNKLGKHTYNPQLKDKDKSKVRPIGNRSACGTATYNAINGQLSKEYEGTKSHPTNLISISSKGGECNSVNRIHPTQKPVALFEYLIKTYTNPGETVLDNCMGSGTTAIACMNTERNFIGFEKDPDYFLKAQVRIQAHRLTPKALTFEF
jgi:site-specific DNA-methyltransferase (adenine-specific)